VSATPDDAQDVEIDETYVGGNADSAGAFKNKTIVMGLKI
jgi:hypothetical protein